MANDSKRVLQVVLVMYLLVMPTVNGYHGQLQQVAKFAHSIYQLMYSNDKTAVLYGLLDNFLAVLCPRCYDAFLVLNWLYKFGKFVYYYNDDERGFFAWLMDNPPPFVFEFLDDIYYYFKTNYFDKVKKLA